VDLSLLSKECTHRLDMPLDEGEGTLVLLVTLTASAAVSIADLSVNILDDPRERKEILQRYVRTKLFYSEEHWECTASNNYDFINMLNSILKENSGEQ